MDYKRLFLDHLDVIEGVVRFIARRHHLSQDEAEELAAAIKLKIIEHEYQVLRRFEGRSSFRTYLTSIVQRYFLDARATRWGKWRPSMQARRLGPVGIQLDQLLTRDGLSFDEAVELLQTNHHVILSRRELYAISVQLPPRTGRHFLGDESLAALAAPLEASVSHFIRDRQLGRREEAVIVWRDLIARDRSEWRLEAERRLRDQEPSPLGPGR